MAESQIDQLLISILRKHEGFSDLFFIVGKPIQVEVHGELQSFPDENPESVLTPEAVERVALALMSTIERLATDFRDLGACDCSHTVPGHARFRVNVFRQNGHHAIVMRKLNTAIPSMDGLKLQPVFREIIKEKTGIIFVTGATGSGKTTTLAAMLNELNETAKMHVVTLEDPIEFVHAHKKAAFSQRELGRDFPTFASGLRAAMRQAPKVILVGEIRDRETMDIALTAAETGHIVYSTLHTINAGQTINRILGFFSKDEEDLVRERLAQTLRYVISQRLIPKAGGGRLMINEIMGSNMRTREVLLIGEGENRSYVDIIEASSAYDWRTFDMALIEAYEKQLITEETAGLFATSKSKVRSGIDRSKKLAGKDETTTDMFRLQVKAEAPAAVMRPAGVPPPVPPSSGTDLSASPPPLQRPAAVPPPVPPASGTDLEPRPALAIAS
jgi:twitching motility protein PilT